MKFNKNEIKELCRKIMLSESVTSCEVIASQLTSFSCDMDRIKNTGFEKKYYTAPCSEYAQLREDTAFEAYSQEDIISNSKCCENGCFMINKVI